MAPRRPAAPAPVARTASGQVSRRGRAGAIAVAPSGHRRDGVRRPIRSAPAAVTPPGAGVTVVTMTKALTNWAGNITFGAARTHTPSSVEQLRSLVAGSDLMRADDDFPGAVVALGALGIVTNLTVDIQPTYDVRQYVYEGLPFADGTQHLAEILGSGYSVSLFTDWTGAGFNQIWLKRRTDTGDASTPPKQWFGGVQADGR